MKAFILETCCKAEFVANYLPVFSDTKYWLFFEKYWSKTIIKAKLPYLYFCCERLKQLKLILSVQLIFWQTLSFFIFNNICLNFSCQKFISREILFLYIEKKNLLPFGSFRQVSFFFREFPDSKFKSFKMELGQLSSSFGPEGPRKVTNWNFALSLWLLMSHSPAFKNSRNPPNFPSVHG